MTTDQDEDLERRTRGETGGYTISGFKYMQISIKNKGLSVDKSWIFSSDKEVTTVNNGHHSDKDEQIDDVTLGSDRNFEYSDNFSKFENEVKKAKSDLENQFNTLIYHFKDKTYVKFEIDIRGVHNNTDTGTFFDRKKSILDYLRFIKEFYSFLDQLSKNCIINQQDVKSDVVRDWIFKLHGRKLIAHKGKYHFFKVTQGDSGHSGDERLAFFNKKVFEMLNLKDGSEIKLVSKIHTEEEEFYAEETSQPILDFYQVGLVKKSRKELGIKVEEGTDINGYDLIAVVLPEKAFV